MKEEKIIITIDATNLTTYVEAVGKRKFKPAYNQPLKRSANKSVRNRRG